MRAALPLLALALAACLLGGAAHAQTNDGSTPVLKSALTGTVATVKAARGNVAYVTSYNPSAAVTYVQLFDAATSAAVTLGTTVPKLVVPIAATSTSHVWLDLSRFSLGIQAAATTAPTGAVAPASAAVVTFGVR